MVDVTLPQLGESVTEGTISKWLVHEGDVVAQGQRSARGRDRQGRRRGPRARRRAASRSSSRRRATWCREDGRRADRRGRRAPLASVRSPLAPRPCAAPGPRAARRWLRRRFARKRSSKASNLGAVQGTGEHGRITKDDVARAQAPGRRGRGGAGSCDASRATQLAPMVNQGGGFVPPDPGRRLRRVQGARRTGRTRAIRSSRSRAAAASPPTT